MWRKGQVMTSLDQNATPSAWLGQAMAHYRAAQQLLKDWHNGSCRVLIVYQQAAAENQAGVLAAMIAAAKYNEFLVQPYEISSTPPFDPGGMFGDGIK